MTGTQWRVWLLSTAERVGKTFLQAYGAFWLLSMGVTDPSGITDPGSAFDALFNMNNFKAGVVAAVLSLITSVVSTPFGVDQNSPSVLVSETPPTLPPAHG